MEVYHTDGNLIYDIALHFLMCIPNAVTSPDVTSLMRMQEKKERGSRFSFKDAESNRKIACVAFPCNFMRLCPVGIKNICCVAEKSRKHFCRET